MNQIALLRQRQFWPLFWTQFLGAFNDNLFKTFLTMMITYRAMSIFGLGKDLLVPLAMGVFILPFFIFSATAGQISDRIPKNSVMRAVKLFEIVVMLAAALGFYLDSVLILLIVLFFMGLQSSFFGPAKYSIVPELLPNERLVAGNALIELGTFLAILLGTVSAGVLIEFGAGTTILSMALITIALLGFITSYFVPRTPRGDPALKIKLDPIFPTWRILKQTAENPPVWRAILGISWFWFYGAALLSLLQLYVPDTLHGDSSVTTLFLGLFCVGIGAGSFACEKLSKGKLEIGLVPLGSIGMTLFTLDLFFARGSTDATQIALTPFVQSIAHWRIMIDFFVIAFSGGLFTVPLYTMVQERTEASVRSRVIAGMNIVNAAFMVVSAVGLMLLNSFSISHYSIFLILAVLTAAVSIYIYTLVPEFLLRFVSWLLTTVMYRVQVRGSMHLPEQGPALLVCNSVSIVDWMLVSSVSPRPVRFILGEGYFRNRFWRFIFRDAKMIIWKRTSNTTPNDTTPTCDAATSTDNIEEVVQAAAAALGDGELVCVFPEGRLTRDGSVAPFQDLTANIIRRAQDLGAGLVPVVPMALGGMWGSTFSRKYGQPRTRPFKRFWAEVQLTIGDDVALRDTHRAEEELAPTALRDEIRRLSRVGHIRRGGLLRAALTGLCHLIVRIFFRRVEIIGAENLPQDGGIIFTPNHPNGLIDPLLIFVSTPRWVSFLTKATLFTTPVINLFVKSFDALPVYRAQDGADPQKNFETLSKARSILGGGAAIAIFPEGTSHSDPQLKRMKTGAARIALGAAAIDPKDGETNGVYIVPVGLYYTDKGTFRSSAAVIYGEPIRVAPSNLDENHEPNHRIARALTEQMAQAIDGITVQAESVELLHIAATAERLITAGRTHSFAEAVEIRQKLIEGHAILGQQDSKRLRKLVRRIRAYDAEREALGVVRGLARQVRVLRVLTWCMVLALPAFVGLITHYISYRAIGLLAKRLAGSEDDTLSSMKVVGALVLLPLTWVMLALGTAALWDWTAAAIVFFALPLCGYATQRFAERGARVMAAWRIFWLTLTRRSAIVDLRERRQSIALELQALQREMDPAG